MTGSTISISDAGREVGLKQQEASLFARGLGLVDEQSERVGNAKMLDRHGFETLEWVAANLGRKPLVAAQ